MAGRFEVQINTICDGWVVFGSSEDAAGYTEALTFDTLEEAREDVRDHLEMMAESCALDGEPFDRDGELEQLRIIERLPDGTEVEHACE